MFNRFIGNFSLNRKTYHYFGTRFAFVRALQRVKTHDSLKAQLDHLMDMLRLDRRNANVCPLIPALMLRLNKDQECYNFVEWWSEMGISVEEIELPCLDVKNANVF